jgi:hypothetical protein
MAINQVTTSFLQGIVDLAVKSNRSVSFISSKSNDMLRDLILQIDVKGCNFHKKDKKDTMVTVWPKLIDPLYT